MKMKRFVVRSNKGLIVRSIKCMSRKLNVTGTIKVLLRIPLEIHWKRRKAKIKNIEMLLTSDINDVRYT